MKTYHCGTCRVFRADHQVVRSDAGKAACGLAGLALGAPAKDMWVCVALGLVGAAIGHVIDTEISPRCPACGAALTAVLPYVLG